MLLATRESLPCCMEPRGILIVQAEPGHGAEAVGMRDARSMAAGAVRGCTELCVAAGAVHGCTELCMAAATLGCAELRCVHGERLELMHSLMPVETS